MTEFTQSIFDEICERISDGESLRSICRDEHMPTKTSVFRWLAADKVLSDQYARSREAQADALFDDILEIADNSKNDWMEKRGEEDVGWLLNGDHIARTKVRIDARKWMAGKMRPKVYGDKVDHTHAGPDGGPLSVTIQRFSENGD